MYIVAVTKQLTIKKAVKQLQVKIMRRIYLCVGKIFTLLI